MTTTFLTLDDLEPFACIEAEKAQAMIDDATAVALLAAPCLGSTGDDALSEGQLAGVKAVLRGAILRWNEAGAGALAMKVAGPFSETLDTRTQRRGMFWPSEIEQLQNICKGEGDGGAFSINTLPSCTTTHADICALNFGAGYCSCGAVLTQNWPLYEWYP